jgi:hypothetical protein
VSWRILPLAAAVTIVTVVTIDPGLVLAEDAGVPAAGKSLPDPRNTVAEVLAPRRFEFCHDADFPLTASEKKWCDLGAGANKKACPTLAEACKRDALAKQIELDEPLSFHLPDLGLPIRVILWTLLGLGVGMLIFALVRHFLDREAKDVVTTAAPSSAGEERAAALAREVETDVQRLLERARLDAAAGDFRAAIGSAYAALLRRLEGAGVVHVEPDQTNGDYLGRVRRERPVVARRMADIVDAVERAQFSETAVTREGFDGVWSGVTGLLAERMGVLALVLGLLLGMGCGQPRADWEHSPSGRAGVIAYLGKRGFTVHERLLSVAKIDESKAEQLVLLPGAHLGADDWKALEKWVEGGGKSLVIAGGKRELPGWIGMRQTEKNALTSDVIVSAKRWGALQVRVPEANRLECQQGSETLLGHKQAAYAAQRRMGAGKGSRVVVLADDFLLRNASLLVADNAAALDVLLRDGGMSNEIAGDLTGLASTNPVESVQRGRLGPALLQLAVFLVIFFVCKGARFGRPVLTRKIERREFAEHVSALGLHYARARGERIALGFMGAYAVDRLRERFGLHVDRSLSGLADAVATRTGRPVGEVMRMLVEARDASRGVPVDNGASDLATVAELCKLLEETGGTGGHKRIPGNI